jgi:hypothetical protein
MTDQTLTLNMPPAEPNPPLMVISIEDPRDKSFTKPLVTIRANGTVQIHEPGADVAAAQVFYRSLQVEGQTLHGKIKDLEMHLERVQKMHSDALSRIEVLGHENARLQQTLNCT